MEEKNILDDMGYQNVGYPKSNILIIDDTLAISFQIIIYLFLGYLVIMRIFFKQITKTSMIRTMGLLIIIVYSLISYFV